MNNKSAQEIFLSVSACFCFAQVFTQSLLLPLFHLIRARFDPWKKCIHLILVQRKILLALMFVNTITNMVETRAIWTPQSCFVNRVAIWTQEHNQLCHCRLISAFKHYGKISVAFLPPLPSQFNFRSLPLSNGF